MDTEERTNAVKPGNYYGTLDIKEREGEYYWTVENYHGQDWFQIPEELYFALSAYFSDLESGYYDGKQKWHTTG